MICAKQNNSIFFKVFCFTLRLVLPTLLPLPMKPVPKRFLGHCVSVPCSTLKYFLPECENISGEHSTIIFNENTANTLGIKTKDWVKLCAPNSTIFSYAQLVTNNKINNGEILLSDTLLFNVAGKECDKNGFLEVVESSTQTLPTAISLELTLLRCPTGWEATDVDLLLAGFFSKPRAISQADVIPVEAATYAPRLLHASWNHDIGDSMIWIQVKLLVGEADVKPTADERLSMWVKKGITQITLGPPTVHQGIPSSVQCPPGLEKSLSELRAAVQPFLTTNYRRRPSNGNCIFCCTLLKK